jgi:hypothetical protein
MYEKDKEGSISMNKYNQIRASLEIKKVSMKRKKQKKCHIKMFTIGAMASHTCHPLTRSAYSKIPLFIFFVVYLS